MINNTDVDLSKLASHLALLAPVPIMHLKSAEETGMERAAFASNRFEVIGEVNTLRKELAVPIYIYSSWLHTDESEQQIAPPSVTWKAFYVGYLDPHKREDRNKLKELRPPSTRGEGESSYYWVVENLHRLSEPYPIQNLRGYKQKKYYSNDFIPRTPLLIEYPGTLV